MKKKVRINELARELEVKPNKILELLPELGVQEKKTHSSSIDEDVAVIVKQRLAGSSDADYVHDDDESDGRDDFGGLDLGDVEAEGSHEVAEPVMTRTAEAGGVSYEQVAVAETPPVVKHHAPSARPLAAPLRPPLGGAAAPRDTKPHAPSPPAAAVPKHVVPRPVPAAPVVALAPPPVQPAATVTVAPGPPAASHSAPAAMPGPPSKPAIPSRNMPIYRPGQVLSGPRQPLPPGVVTETRTAEARMPGQATPGAPGPPPPRPAGPRMPSAPPSIAIPARTMHPHAKPGTPQSHAPAAPHRPNFAGQPAARPVVPPRADLVARLAQSKAMPGQAAPAVPRPGMPTRPQASPVPGQPIYRGPIRPGQPLMRGPGGPGAPAGPGGFQNRGPRARPLHPTSPMRPGGVEPAAPPPTDTQRRPQFKPGARPVDRRRDMEGKSFRQPVQRREQPAPPPPIDREITIAEGITVKELSEKLGIKANLVIKKLVERKIFATINQNLDSKMAEDISREFGAATKNVSYEEEKTQEVELAEDTKDLVRRAPVVTIMGHVDHGKTSLLDAIRSANVAGREAGGITQHIGAYQIEKNGRKIVFIDTPGHEAFTRMRARGAKVTDIVILVVSADDGVMPQTLEAIDHARAAKVPIIVAINKIDKPDAQPERVKQQLADRNLLAEDWGGDTVMVPVSAKTKVNLDLLLEMVLLVADIGDFKANPMRPGVGTVLEAQLDRGRGPVATVLVQNGTLRVGDFFICGQVFGKIRAMFGDLGQQVREAEPSTPVEVLGLDSMPEVGDSFQVITDTAKAKQIVLYREAKNREKSMQKGSRLTLEQFHEQVKEGDIKELNIILKTDVGGTAEVLSDMLQKLSNEKVKIRVLSKGVGAITESDVLLASASEAVIIGFNVKPERAASSIAEKEKVDVRLHSIIYELTDEIKKAMSGMLDPVYKEVFRGRAVVRDVFKITKVGIVAGSQVIDGVLTRNSHVRVLRENVVVHTGKIESLKRFKDDVSEVKSGFECGVTVANFADVKPGDVFETFVNERQATEIF